MKAILLDRDETLNHDPGYMKNPDDMNLIKHVPEGLRMLKDAGFTLFILTNQSGIGRGIILPEELEAVNARLLSLLERENIFIKKIYICPHTDEEKCNCRKPLPGLVEQAIKENQINPEESFIIGDRHRDILCAQNAGIKGILINSKDSGPRPSNFIYHATDMKDAASYILKHIKNETI